MTPSEYNDLLANGYEQPTHLEVAGTYRERFKFQADAVEWLKAMKDGRVGGWAQSTFISGHIGYDEDSEEWYVLVEYGHGS